MGKEAKKLQATLNDPEEFAALRERIFARAQEDEATQKSLMGGASKALGAVVGVLSAVGTLALNTLLSIFFFSFFLANLPPSANATEQVKEAITLCKAYLKPPGCLLPAKRPYKAPRR